MALDSLRSVGGLQIASGWLMQTPLGLFVLASRWLERSQWVAYVDSIGIICYSQWVVYADPLTLCVLASGWLAQFHLVSFSFFSFTCSASGWPVCSQWVVYTIFSLFLFFPFSASRFGKRLA